MFLQGSIFSVQQRFGEKNKVAGSLSQSTMLLTILHTAIPAFDCLKKCITVMKTLGRVGSWSQNYQVKQGFVHDGFLFFDNCLCIPQSSLRLQLIHEMHGNGLGGHFGREYYLPVRKSLLLTSG